MGLRTNGGGITPPCKQFDTVKIIPQQDSAGFSRKEKLENDCVATRAHYTSAGFSRKEKPIDLRNLADADYISAGFRVECRCRCWKNPTGAQSIFQISTSSITIGEIAAVSTVQLIKE